MLSSYPPPPSGNLKLAVLTTNTLPLFHERHTVLCQGRVGNGENNLMDFIPVYCVPRQLCGLQPEVPSFTVMCVFALLEGDVSEMEMFRE